MKIKEEWKVWKEWHLVIISISPMILSGCTGWILDAYFGFERWPIYWLLGSFGVIISLIIFSSLQTTKGK